MEHFVLRPRRILSVSQISKTLPGPSPNGLEDLLREILVFKSRKGGMVTKKKDVYVSSTQ